MSIFVYECEHCEDDPFERDVEFSQRDCQCCRICGTKAHRMSGIMPMPYKPWTGPSFA